MSRSRAGQRLWAAVGAAGEVALTIGLLLLLLVTYQIWWTNVVASRATQLAGSSLREQWDRPLNAGDVDRDPSPRTGEAFAVLYIPRLRSDVWDEPIIQGVRPKDLSRGVGHYPATALPGQLGNFALAGHRATNGEPLRNIDRLRVGDEVVVETEDDWFVYELTSSRVVRPTDTWVIDPVPGKPGAKPTKTRITLTSCHPRWASYLRYIWFGVQRQRLPKSEGRTPDALEGKG